MDYWEWNNTVAIHFFRPEHAGEKVFLHVDADLIGELSGSADGVKDFVPAILKGPRELDTTGLNPCRKSIRLMEDWRKGPADGMPPYIGYLALFVLGAAMEGAYQNEGYYKRLHRLMGEEATNVPPRNFYDSKVLWDDLKQWANEDKGGSLGIVKCDFAGATPYVNLPRAQILLSGQERKQLPNIFALADLEPSAPPSAGEMLRIALRLGGGRLEAKTLRRLNGQGGRDEEMISLTIEAMLEELRSWDRIIPGGAESAREFHTLRINLQILDRLSGHARSRLIAKDSEAFPDGGVTLEGGQFALEGFDGKWSGPLKSESGDVDAAARNWDQGMQMRGGGFVFRLPARSVRTFSMGEFDGVKGLLEVNRLDPYREFYVAASPVYAASVNSWGQRASPATWTPIGLRSGLPKGWVLYHAKSANPDVAPPEGHPALNCDPSVRILFENGIKVKPAGRKYFTFAPPDLVVDGLAPGMEVFANETKLDLEPGNVRYKFAESVEPKLIQIEIRREGKEVCGAAFELIAPRDIPWRLAALERVTFADGLSGIRPDAGSYVCGGLISNFTAPPAILGVEKTSDLIGAKVGEVKVIPNQQSAGDWDPVWLIEHGRGRRKVLFCGGDPAACMPVENKSADRRQAKEWKRILWYERKNLAGPTRGALAALWVKYREAARNV